MAEQLSGGIGELSESSIYMRFSTLLRVFKTTREILTKREENLRLIEQLCIHEAEVQLKAARLADEAEITLGKDELQKLLLQAKEVHIKEGKGVRAKIMDAEEGINVYEQAFIKLGTICKEAYDAIHKTIMRKFGIGDLELPELGVEETATAIERALEYFVARRSETARPGQGSRFVRSMYPLIRNIYIPVSDLRLLVNVEIDVVLMKSHQNIFLITLPIGGALVCMSGLILLYARTVGLVAVCLIGLCVSIILAWSGIAMLREVCPGGVR
jgi:hypothetical protein